jgi:hypothetical protein
MTLKNTSIESRRTEEMDSRLQRVQREANLAQNQRDADPEKLYTNNKTPQRDMHADTHTHTHTHTNNATQTAPSSY